MVNVHGVGRSVGEASTAWVLRVFSSAVKQNFYLADTNATSRIFEISVAQESRCRSACLKTIYLSDSHRHLARPN